jgi:4-amino-4-deoxy-L-arabinose transferase-like glycosyltransferase
MVRDGHGVECAAVNMRLSRFFVVLATISWTKCLLLFLLVVALIPGHRTPGYYPDSAMYEIMASNILAGRGLSLSTAPPFEPTMMKEPLYPAVIALFKAAFGGWSRDVLIFVQILINPLIAILIYLIGKRVFDERVARYAALLVAVIPLYADMSFSVMPEAFFMVVFLSTIVLLLDIEKTGSVSGFLLAGVLLGLAALIKNVLVPVAALYPVALLIRHRRSLTRRMVLNAVLFFLVFALVTVPWMWRGKEQLGLFSISVRGGMVFAAQARWAADFTSDQWKAYGVYMLSGHLAQKLYPQVIGSDFGEYEYTVILRRDHVAELAKTHREGEVEGILVREGLRDFVKHPFKFAALAVLVDLQTMKYLLPGSLLDLEGPRRAAWLLPMLRVSLTLTGILFTLLTLRGIWLYRDRWGEGWVLLGMIAYLHVVSASLGIVPGGILRHVLPVTVLYTFFIVIAVRRRALWRCAPLGSEEPRNLSERIGAL